MSRNLGNPSFQEPFFHDLKETFFSVTFRTSVCCVLEAILEEDAT